MVALRMLLTERERQELRESIIQLDGEADADSVVRRPSSAVRPLLRSGTPFTDHRPSP